MLNDGEWKTDDTVLAALLIHRGHILLRTGWRGSACEWYFTENDDLVDTVMDYHSGQTHVELRSYMNIYTDTKKKMLNDRARRSA